MANVCFFQGLDKSKRLKSRIELHLHLDGAFRLSTVWDLAKKKGLDLGFESLDDLREAVIVKRPCTLRKFLQPFQFFLPVFIGDAEALERGAYELCEDQAKEGVLYFEARYSPHGCSNTHGLLAPRQFVEGSPGSFSPKQVVQAIQKGLNRGQRDFRVKARSILCCLRGQPEWNEDVLSLCLEFSKEGVVGIDIAGGEDDMSKVQGEEILVKEDAAIFKKAAAAGVHRTVHAGEAGSAANVSYALKEMHAERIGHGYRVLEDLAVYEEVLRRDIHLETCPHSSLLTSAVPLSTAKHPIVRFAEDGANFSINKDDPTLIGTTLSDEYEILQKMGLSEAHFARANFNAARSCFLPSDEKDQLIDQLKEIYGIKA